MAHRRIPKSNKHKKIKWVDKERGRADPNAPDPNKRNLPVSRKDCLTQKEPQRLLEILDRRKTKKRKPKKTAEEKKLAKNMANKLVICSGLKNQKEAGMTRSLPEIPEKLEQGPYESKYAFLKRVDKMVEQAMLEAKLVERFDADPYGKVTDISTKNSKEKDEEANKESSKKQKQKKRAKLRRQKLKAKKEEEQDDFSHLKDEVKFGEVAERPPKISKVGKLSEKINKAKLKTEQERQNAVTMYRYLKKQKVLHHKRQELIRQSSSKQ